jgi:glycosyltransferase involved in cell wall biosynthesis
VTTGVVAIGRNEGERLRACLVSARRDCQAVVYVDSGSTDGSTDLARSLGVHVIDLDLSKPFTAARARNEGFAELMKIEPALGSVQFVDGDCEIVEGWIQKAQVELAANPRAAIICGRRRERFPDASIYNKLCDMEWDTPIGIAKACGGDALIRVAAFKNVAGYNPTVIAGEEPEMCVRLREQGWTIHRIDAEMTLHDAAMTRFGQWWKRNVRAGYAYAMGNDLHGKPPERFRAREMRSIKTWVVWPIGATIVCVIGIALVAARWCGLGLVPLLLYPMLAAKVARKRMSGGTSAVDALLYGLSVAIGKFPQWLGVQRFRTAARNGERVGIIEYKGTPR